jgi:hypothetical protein
MACPADPAPRLLEILALRESVYPNFPGRGFNYQVQLGRMKPEVRWGPNCTLKELVTVTHQV